MESKRNGTIDFWKFIFSVLIVIFHGKNLAEGEGWIFPGGSIGVEFFFIVSGVLLAASASKNMSAEVSLGKDTFQFMKRKISGLMPNIYIAWIIAFLVEHIDNFSIEEMCKHAVKSVWELLFLTESGLRSYSANAVCWYISAMLLVMLIIYPLLRKYKDTFFYIIAPLIVIFSMGITYQEWNNLRVPHTWNGLFYKSLIRAVMEIALGCLCYKFSQAICKATYTRIAKVFWTILEWGGYTAVLIWVYGRIPSKMDWTLVLLLAVSITCTFSQVSITDRFFSRHKIFNWLGEFSFSLFLGHGYWSHKMKILFPDLDYWQRLPIYMGLAFGTGIFIMYVSKEVKKLWCRWKPKAVSMFIIEAK